MIAPQGLKSQAEDNSDWSVHDGQPHPRDDVAFVGAVLDDASARFNLDRTSILLSGFSRGASMVWDIACLAPAPPSLSRSRRLLGAGATRAGPVQLLHTHGFSDVTVPLEGQPLRHGTMLQSDIFAGLQLWRRVDGCGSKAGRFDTSGPIWRKVWTDCKAGSVELALHAGSHEVPAGWADMAIDWFQDLPRGSLDPAG